MDLKGNVIYAVDFDGTLSFGRFPGVGDPNDNLFRFLKEEQRRGARLILNTCRTGAIWRSRWSIAGITDWNLNS